MAAEQEKSINEEKPTFTITGTAQDMTLPIKVAGEHNLKVKVVITAPNIEAFNRFLADLCNPKEKTST